MPGQQHVAIKTAPALFLRNVLDFFDAYEEETRLRQLAIEARSL